MKGAGAQLRQESRRVTMTRGGFLATGEMGGEQRREERREERDERGEGRAERRRERGCELARERRGERREMVVGGEGRSEESQAHRRS